MQVEVIDCDFLAEELVLKLGDDFNHFITDFFREGSFRFLNIYIIKCTLSCYFNPIGPLHATFSKDKKQLKIFGLINRAEIKHRIENSIKKPKFYGFEDMIFQPSIKLVNK